MQNEIKNKPLVSIVIPSYNHEKFIEDTVRSVWNQTYTNIELIVLDDGSKDNSPKILEKLKKLSPIPMTVIIKENEGLCKTLNKGISFAKGEYISFLGSDDRFLPNKIELLLPYFDDKDLGFVYSDGYLIDELGNSYQKISHGKNFKSGHIFEDLLIWNFMIQYVTALHKTSIIKEVGGFDESICFEDWDLFLKISNKYKVLYVDELVGEYRQHQGERLNQNVDKIVPDIFKIINNNLSNNKIKLSTRYVYFRIYKMISRLYLNIRDTKKSRKYIIKAICKNPICLECYLTFFKSLLGKRIITFLSKLKAKI